MTISQQNIDLLALNLVTDVGAIRLKNLIEYFGGISNVFKARESDLCKVRGITSKIAKDIVSIDDNMIDQQLKAIKKYDVQVISVFDKQYPSILKNIYSPPIMLFVRGNPFPEKDTAIAIVGTRKASFYGMKTAEKLSYELGLSKITIVSGMAAGVDTNAHKGALKAQTHTIAVLGCGVDICYPFSNKRLFSEIIEKGTVVSELPMGFHPEKFTFPMRNRIISGLSKGVVVVEAAKKSGSLITADLALEQGREVFAVPGRIDCTVSQGTLALIRNGAKLVQSVEDIFDEIDLRQNNTDLYKTAPKLTKDQQMIIDMLSIEPVYIDDLQQRLKWDFGLLSATLLDLQLTGLILELPGKLYTAN